jgi:hypothetical protein
MAKIHDFEKIFRKGVRKIEELKTFPENKDAILRFKDYLLSEGMAMQKLQNICRI